MKTGKFLSIITLAGTTLFVSACSESVTNVEESLATVVEEKSSEVEAVLADSCILNGTLTEAEIEGLMEMREEEKLAHDVYLALFDKWDYIVFSNISKSENAHSNAVLYLINGYGLTDPGLEGEGEFSNPLFADLYVQLTENGSVSLVEALKTGAFIEEYDIADLERLLEETQNADIIRVYSNLLAGSKNHLRAFTNALARQGESYTTTIITEEQYQEILNDSPFADQNDTESDFTPGICDGTGPNS